MVGYSCGVVMIVVVQDGYFLLVREYVVGIYLYELGFFKGFIDQGEIVLEVVNCELKEEVGFGVYDLQEVYKVNMVLMFFNV